MNANHIYRAPGSKSKRPGFFAGLIYGAVFSVLFYVCSVVMALYLICVFKTASIITQWLSALLTLILLTSCSTVIYENGRPVLRTYADMANVTFKTHDTYFHADLVTHSIPTTAAGNAIVGAIGALGTAVGGAASAILIAR